MQADRLEGQGSLIVLLLIYSNFTEIVLSLGKCAMFMSEKAVKKCHCEKTSSIVSGILEQWNTFFFILVQPNCCVNSSLCKEL